MPACGCSNVLNQSCSNNLLNNCKLFPSFLRKQESSYFPYCSSGFTPGYPCPTPFGPACGCSNVLSLGLPGLTKNPGICRPGKSVRWVNVPLAHFLFPPHPGNFVNLYRFKFSRLGVLDYNLRIIPSFLPKQESINFRYD